MKTYRRIEVNAFRRRVTVVSGEWRPSDLFQAQPAQTDDRVWINDSDLREPVAADSPEGQLILVAAVRSLAQRLSPEARATICACENNHAANRPNRIGFYLKLQSFYQLIRPKVLRFARKEK